MHKSMVETQQHKNQVNVLISNIVKELIDRGVNHDNSKLEEPEVGIFAEYTSKLATCTYGSDEYKQYLQEMTPALTHHYQNNRHHPEHFENGIKDMDLVDLIELICDWKAATMRHNDGNIHTSIDLNQARFGYSDELKQIFKNSLKYFG